jgi:hypothetical protein
MCSLIHLWNCTVVIHPVPCGMFVLAVLILVSFVAYSEGFKGNERRF